MAAHGESQDEHGSIAISEYVKTWAGFTAFVKWSATGIVVVIAILALFRTHG